MAAPMWPGNSSGFDETNELLNGLLHAERQRRSDGLRRLEAAAARLDDVPPDVVEAPIESRERRDERSERSDPRPDPAPFVPLPQRTTRGGPFGPKVREKLTREALQKRGWW